MSANKATSKEARILEEYRQLREELGVNRKFIFERPLVIVGVAFAAMLNLKGPTGMPQGITALLLLLLIFNLWFTFNRFRSNARIIAYIRTILEGSPEDWIGWERALAKYRKWYEDNKADVLKKIEDEVKNLNQDTHRIYNALFLFHLLMGGLATAAMVVLWIGRQLSEVVPEVLTIVIGIIYIVMIYLAIRYWHPDKNKNLIVIQTGVWYKVLNNNNNTWKEEDPFFITVKGFKAEKPQNQDAVQPTVPRENFFKRMFRR